MFLSPPPLRTRENDAADALRTTSTAAMETSSKEHQEDPSADTESEADTASRSWMAAVLAAKAAAARWEAETSFVLS